MMQREQVTLEVIQQPLRAQVVPENGNKNRKSIDPPPVVQFRYDARNDQANKEWLVSPRVFMIVELYPADEDRQVKYLSGQLTSSLHKLKDIGAEKDGGYFIFGDVSVKKVGTYKLRFHLFDTTPSSGINGEETCTAELLTSIDSEPFEVKNSREFGSMSESTPRTKTFSDQGVKLRVRKQNSGSTAGQKRSYPSPDVSPTGGSGYYGAAVQYGSPHHSAAKRHRSQSDFNASHTQQYHEYMNSEGSMGYPGGGVRSTGQGYVPGHTRGHSYSTHPSTGMNYSYSRMPAYSTSSAQSWQSMQSAQPSPSNSTSVAAQQASPSYPGIAPQASTPTSYTDPTVAAGMPLRNTSYYGAAYPQYSTGAHYQPQAPAEAHQAYADLQMPGTSLTDTSAITAQEAPYSSTYGASMPIFGAADGYAARYSDFN